MLGNDVIQFWLREFRLIAFIVTMSAVAQQIDKNILSEFLTVFNGQVRHKAYRFSIIAIYVKYRSINNLGKIRTINTGSAHHHSRL